MRLALRNATARARVYPHTPQLAVAWLASSPFCSPSSSLLGGAPPSSSTRSAPDSCAPTGARLLRAFHADDLSQPRPCIQDSQAKTSQDQPSVGSPYRLARPLQAGGQLPHEVRREDEGRGGGESDQPERAGPCPQQYCWHSWKNATQMPAISWRLTAALAVDHGLQQRDEGGLRARTFLRSSERH
eukprot:COSAG04_NODE_1522_length_6466_cov_5.303720_4_plen_186_part_00